MKELKLVLKKKWYDLINSGEKKEEYRELTDYWEKRLWEFSNCCDANWPKDYDCVTFYLGYAKDRPQMTFQVTNIDIGTGRPEWGATPGKYYFVISLGRRII